jgi:TonB family protein
MNIPEEFGRYLLLKKLREDALGEVFRAGRVGGEGIEQVVLLRVFNGLGIDGEKLWQRISGRAPVQQALRSPNIGSGADLGKVRSFPYAAYDYISGKNLATLFAQAVRQRQPIPVDHALLISERLALALAAAYETRVQDERVLHGFVVPHLVMISNEGETRLLGFEVAPGLRELWAGGWRNDDLRGYLAPEAVASAEVAKSDDVYALGAVLFELLASERLPGLPAEGYAPLIDALVLPSEGTPLPPAIAALLKKSLAPRDQRIPDAMTWHKTISKLMIEGQFSSTTFNLAFFMHNLFRDEIDREHQEMEAEKRLALPRLQTAGAGVAAATGAAAAGGAAIGGAGAAGAAEARERTGVHDAAWAASAAAPAFSAHTGAGAGAGTGRKPLWIGIAAAAALLLAVGGYLLFGRSGGAAKAASPPAAAGGSGGSAAAGDAARNAAALQAQIQQMIEARSKEMESKLKDQYNDQIKQLQQKLEESRRTATQEKDKGRAERQAEAAAQPAPAPAAAPAGAERSPTRAERPERADAAAPAGAASPSSATPQREAAAAGAPATSAAPAAAPVPPPPAAVPAAETGGGARQPQLQVGDLVQPGPGVVVPKLVFRPDTRFPGAARRMNRSAEVLVRLLVDERGQVEKAERVGAAAGLGFDEAALEVARHSNYEPATKDGVRVKMWTTMKVSFKPMG